MKKILFVVGSRVNEQFALKLCGDYPYGRTRSFEWNTVPYDENLLTVLKDDLPQYDIVYEIQQSKEIRTRNRVDLALISNISTETLTACGYVQTPYIICEDGQSGEKRPLRQLHPTVVTLYYQRTDDASYDYTRITSDIANIIHKRPSAHMPKRLYQGERFITRQEQNNYRLKLSDCKNLSSEEKKLCGLPQTEECIPSFVESTEINPEYYCYVSKKVRDVIHFDAWLKLANHS